MMRTSMRIGNSPNKSKNSTVKFRKNPSVGGAKYNKLNDDDMKFDSTEMVTKGANK